MKENLEPRNYWQERHSRTDLSTVGFIGFGIPFNFWMYKIRAVVFNSIIRQQKLDFSKEKVLDVGSGSGFYLQQFKALKAADLSGSDFSDKAVRKLRTTFKGTKIINLDITGSVPKKGQKKYSLINAFDILYHIVDDKKYSRAIENISAMLKKNGLFIFTENFLQNKNQRDLFQVNRSRRTILKLLRKNHFQVLTVKPIFYLMNTPVDSESKFLKIWWFIFSNSITRLNFLGHLFGAVLYPAELLLVKLAKNYPSTKIIVCKKTA